MPGVAFAFLAQVVEEAGASVWGGELGFVEAVEVVVRDEPEAAVSGKPAVQGSGEALTREVSSDEPQQRVHEPGLALRRARRRPRRVGLGWLVRRCSRAHGARPFLRGVSVRKKVRVDSYGATSRSARAACDF